MYKINKGFIVQKMANGITIFDPESSTMHSMNTLGALIFSNLKKGLNKEEICNIVVDKYSVNRKIAEKDFREFLKELVQRKIVERLG